MRHSIYLQQLAMGQHAQFLAAQRLHMRTGRIKPHPNYLRDAAGTVAICLVELCLRHLPHVPRLNTEHR